MGRPAAHHRSCLGLAACTLCQHDTTCLATARDDQVDPVGFGMTLPCRPVYNTYIYIIHLQALKSIDSAPPSRHKILRLPMIPPTPSADPPPFQSFAFLRQFTSFCLPSPDICCPIVPTCLGTMTASPTTLCWSAFLRKSTSLHPTSPTGSSHVGLGTTTMSDPPLVGLPPSIIRLPRGIEHRQLDPVVTGVSDPPSAGLPPCTSSPPTGHRALAVGSSLRGSAPQVCPIASLYRAYSCLLTIHVVL
jgi:hypothetical protein